jgi:hypothetical protein
VQGGFGPGEPLPIGRRAVQDEDPSDGREQGSVNGARPDIDDYALVNELVADAVSHRPAEIRRALERADGVGTARYLDCILMPAIRRIAQSVDDGLAPVLAISLAVETARASMERLTAHAPLPGSHRPVVLATGPGDRHSLGLEALTMLLRYRRQPCRLLDAGVTASRIRTAVEVNRPAGVVLVAQRGSGRRACVELLRGVEAIGTPTFYAGAAFEPAAVRRDVPGIYLGSSFEQALSVITRTLAPELAARAPNTE